MKSRCQQTTVTAATVISAVAFGVHKCDHSRCAWQNQCAYGRCQTCGRPPSPAMHVKLSSRDLNRSNSAGGVFNRGAGPGAVGSVSTPSDPKSLSKCAEICCLFLRAAWICKHYTSFTARSEKEKAYAVGRYTGSICTQKQPRGHSILLMSMSTRTTLRNHVYSCFKLSSLALRTYNCVMFVKKRAF